MNAIVRLTESEGDVVTLEATDAKVDALRESVDKVEKDTREIRTEMSSLRDQMYAGFAALRDKIDSLRDRVDGVQAAGQNSHNTLQASIQNVHNTLQASIQATHNTLQASIAGLAASIAELRATIKMMIWAISLVGMLMMIFLSAGKALHWFETPAQAKAQSSDEEVPSRP